MKKQRMWLKNGIALWMAACMLLVSVIPVYGWETPEEGNGEQEPALEELFSDASFRAYIAEHIDQDQNGKLSQEEAAQVTELSVSSQGISSLHGISCFPNLKVLDCSYNRMGALELRGLEHLYALICTNNEIALPVNENNQVDFTAVPDLDSQRILEISDGTWVEEGVLQLPEDFQSETLTYVYDTAGMENAAENGQQGEFWKMQVTVVLENIPKGEEETQPEDLSVSENVISENQSVKEIQAGKEKPLDQKDPAGTLQGEGVNEESMVLTKKSYPAKIKSCKILSNKSRVQVKATISGSVKSKDSYCYLFTLPQGTSKLSKPAAKVRKKKSITFTVPLNYNKSGDRLTNKFLVAVKSGKKYTAISAGKYISNPEIMASGNLAFTKGKSKKGLQFGESLPDAISLGINYCLFNLNITDFTKKGGERLKYNYKGKNYSFSREAFDRWGSLFAQLQDNKINLSAEFLLPWDAGQTDLILPAARKKNSAHYYAWNISSKAAREKYEALFSCIAEEFDGSHGRGYINNYIIGNEVDAYSEWHYTGSTSLKKNTDLYADTYKIVYMAVKSKSKNSRISICLTHRWNISEAGNYHSSRSFLDKVADRLKTYGIDDFTIAYHAYSQPLVQTEFWNNSAQYVKNSVDSPFITMKNIEYLTKYVKSKYGTKVRIMLTEQGFSSHVGEQKQAAAIAYAYYKAEFNSMIDCIIFRCQVDNQGEINSDNLHMGLWTVNMGKKKAAYDVFKYMDTSKGEAKTKSCRKQLKINNWSTLVPGYKASRFK